MKRIYLALCFCIASSVTLSAQTVDEKKKEKYEAEVEEKKQEYINDLVETLNVDDFQKEIIKQTMNSYFEKVQKIHQLNIRPFEKKGQIEQLDITHFEDLKAMISEDTMSKILDALKGKWDKKKEKRKKKRKKQKN